jgi:hypothetical protein
MYMTFSADVNGKSMLILRIKPNNRRGSKYQCIRLLIFGEIRQSDYMKTNKLED